MRFLDDKENKEEKENINGAECERKQGNDEGRHCKHQQSMPKTMILINNLYLSYPTDGNRYYRPAINRADDTYETFATFILPPASYPSSGLGILSFRFFSYTVDPPLFNGYLEVTTCEDGDSVLLLHNDDKFWYSIEIPFTCGSNTVEVCVMRSQRLSINHLKENTYTNHVRIKELVNGLFLFSHFKTWLRNHPRLILGKVFAIVLILFQGKIQYTGASMATWSPSASWRHYNILCGIPYVMQ